MLLERQRQIMPVGNHGFLFMPLLTIEQVGFDRLESPTMRDMNIAAAQRLPQLFQKTDLPHLPIDLTRIRADRFAPRIRDKTKWGIRIDAALILTVAFAQILDAFKQRFIGGDRTQVKPFNHQWRKLPDITVTFTQLVPIDRLGAGAEFLTIQDQALQLSLAPM